MPVCCDQTGAFTRVSPNEAAAIQAFRTGDLEFAVGRDMLPRASAGWPSMVMSAWQLSPDEPMERSQNARGKSKVYARPRLTTGCSLFFYVC